MIGKRYQRRKPLFGAIRQRSFSYETLGGLRPQGIDFESNSLLGKLLQMNKLLLALTIFFSVFGVMAIYSATYMRSGSWHYLSKLWVKQTIWVILGFGLHFAVALIDYRWVREKFGAIVIYVVGLILLIVTEIRGVHRSGAQSWLEIGPIEFQPSQVAVLGGILILALVLSETGPTMNPVAPWLRILFAGMLVGGPFLLILIQPDLGSALVWVPIVLAMLFVGGIPKRWIALLVITGCGICAPLAIAFVLQGYQLDRLMVFTDPERDPLDSGYAILQALTAIGSAGLTGRGWLAPNTQNANGFIPISTAHNDYIFAVIAEQIGLAPTLILLFALTVFILTAIYIGLKAADHLGALMATGIAALFFTHIFLNTGMTVSFVPITGLPLPLLSYGGTFATLILFSIGLLQSIWIHRNVGN